jgi:hypothetical protein
MMNQPFPYVKIEVFLPEEYIEILRDRLHDVNVGRIGQYDHCLSITNVRGYWRPLAGALPHAGQIGEICYGQECKVEVNCRREAVDEAVKVIRDIHPYEKPLINVLPLLNHQFDGLEL